MARSCETLPKNRCPASINSFDENWFVADGGDGEVTSEDGGCGMLPVVWATTDVVATAAATTLAIAAPRKLALMAGSTN
jgi:hypothetical protein